MPRPSLPVRTGVDKSLLTPRANLREMSTGQVNRRAFLRSATQLAGAALLQLGEQNDDYSCLARPNPHR
jgi:hypothetical protein